MNRAWILGAGVAALVAGVCALNAQQVGFPPPAGSVAALCVYNASQPTITTGNPAFIQCDASGNLRTTGGGGGGGGAVTIADGADVAEGTTTDAACAGDATSGCTSLSRISRVAARLTTAITALGSPFQAGGSIGNTSFAVTNAGTFAVQVSNANANGQVTMANSSPVVIASNQSAVPVTQSGTWTVGQTSQYPATAVVYSATATGTTGATTATLAASGGAATTYLCGFSIRANATAAATGNATVTGTLSGTMNFTQWTAPNASGLGVSEMIFTPCYPASAANTAIAVVSAAPGTGGVVSVTAWGYKL